MESDPQITAILRAISRGEAGADETLYRIVYDDLKRIAARRMSREREGHTLQPTALIHEAYPRLLGDQNANWRDRRHFLGAAAEAMRRVLVDHARRRAREKRGAGNRRVDFPTSLAVDGEQVDDLIRLNEALEKLEAQDESRAEVVKLKFFVGMTHAEIAEALETPLRTVERRWAFARAWLQTELDS